LSVCSKNTEEVGRGQWKMIGLNWFRSSVMKRGQSMRLDMDAVTMQFRNYRVLWVA